MIFPQKPKNEIQRLKILNSLNILDTSSEERFDRITRVAQRLFGVPIASVSFVDKEREWYKSQCGLKFTETPRAISFGSYAILQDNTMIVEDALKDERFQDNPLVIGQPGIRFYLGCPLKINGQFNIGILGLIDRRSQQFNEFDLNIIKDLAFSIEAEFDINNLATIDELTKISNRRGLILIGKQIIKRCNEFDKDVLLLYFDLFQLKWINDNYGRNEGDMILKIFAQQLLKNFRNTDAIARLGGDRFCVLCSGMSSEHVPNVIQRFKNKLSLLQIKYPIQFRTNAVEYKHWKHYSIHSLLDEADERMYEYKRVPH